MNFRTSSCILLVLLFISLNESKTCGSYYPNVKFGFFNCEHGAEKDYTNFLREVENDSEAQESCCKFTCSTKGILPCVDVEGIEVCVQKCPVHEGQDVNHFDLISGDELGSTRLDSFRGKGGAPALKSIDNIQEICCRPKTVGRNSECAYKTNELDTCNDKTETERICKETGETCVTWSSYDQWKDEPNLPNICDWCPWKVSPFNLGYPFEKDCGCDRAVEKGCSHCKKGWFKMRGPGPCLFYSDVPNCRKDKVMNKRGCTKCISGFTSKVCPLSRKVLISDYKVDCDSSDCKKWKKKWGDLPTNEEELLNSCNNEKNDHHTLRPPYCIDVCIPDEDIEKENFCESWYDHYEQTCPSGCGSHACSQSLKDRWSNVPTTPNKLEALVASPGVETTAFDWRMLFFVLLSLNFVGLMYFMMNRNKGEVYTSLLLEVE